MNTLNKMAQGMLAVVFTALLAAGSAYGCVSSFGATGSDGSLSCSLSGSYSGGCIYNCTCTSTGGNCNQARADLGLRLR